MIDHEMRIMAAVLFLRHDIQQFARSVLPAGRRKRISKGAWSIRKIADLSKVSEAHIRGIANPDWRPSPSFMVKIEHGLRGEPGWPGREGRYMRETTDDSGCAVRRVKEQLSEAQQADVAKCSNLGTFEIERPDVTVVDVSMADPRHFRIEKHSQNTAAVAGEDRTGRRLSQSNAPVYGQAVMDDYLWCKATGEPQASDVFWYAKTGQSRFYTRLLIPAGHLVFSVLEIHNPSSLGSLEYSANI
jgi:hypothetical protein